MTTGHDLGSGIGTILLLEKTRGRTLLLMLRWHTVLLTSPQGTRANEVGAEVLLAISREFGKSLEWLLTGEK